MGGHMQPIAVSLAGDCFAALLVCRVQFRSVRCWMQACSFMRASRATAAFESILAAARTSETRNARLPHSPIGLQLVLLAPQRL